jgi:hypothetical protein
VIKSETRKPFPTSSKSARTSAVGFASDPCPP